MTYRWISLTTDFGLADGFVGVLHGVIARLAPATRIIDITHDVHPGDVPRGAAILAQSVVHLPPAVHVAVVDPGVGGSRRGVAIVTPGGLLVGPDNGLLTAAADALGGLTGAFELTNAAWHAVTVAPTFHGRDIFAPAAARLALGESPEAAGTTIDPDSLVRLPPPVVASGDGYVEAEVLTVDRFGNVQLAAAASALDALGAHVTVSGMRATNVRTYSDAPMGALIVLADSAGHAAIAINGGRAVVMLGVEPGDMLRIARA